MPAECRAQCLPDAFQTGADGHRHGNGRETARASSRDRALAQRRSPSPGRSVARLRSRGMDGTLGERLKCAAGHGRLYLEYVVDWWFREWHESELDRVL